MKKIILTKNKYAIVNDSDFGYLNKFKWKFSVEGYAVTNFATGYKKRKSVSMHRLVINPFTEFSVDHIDGNKLNNRIENLRICTHQQNTFNRKKLSNKTSIYKGVGFYKRTGRWQARITFNRKLIHLGMFDDPKEAASAYNIAAKKYFGKFAWKKFRGPQ